VYGGAMATQEADNVIFVQKAVGSRMTKTINVAKNRFAGGTGFLPLQFDRKTRCYRDLSKAAVKVRNASYELREGKSKGGGYDEEGGGNTKGASYMVDGILVK
jgi:hypothetical protein